MNDYMLDLNTRFCIGMDRKEAGELLALLNRALNTMEPRDWPTWVDGLTRRLESFSHAKIGDTPGGDGGMTNVKIEIGGTGGKTPL